MKLKADNEELSNIFVNSCVTMENSKRKCIEDARLVFCTPYSSSWLENQEFDILVIDEAANLKECKLMIPLAISGIKQVVLIGDDKQLKSVVRVCLHYKII